TIVVAPDSSRVRAVVDDLRRHGREVIVVRGNDSDARRTESWDRVRAGACVVVGGRVAVLAPVPDLGAVVVLDEGDEALKEERAPAWNARELALERADRAGARCTLVSPAPTLEAEAAVGQPARPRRPFEREGWPRFDVIDVRDEPPGRGLFSDALTAALHATVDRGARAVCVVNRKGRAQLLVCRQCGQIAQCEVCGAAVAETQTGFVCRRCGTERPRVCLHCHSTRFSGRRPGVTRVREEMAALLPRATVAEVDAATAALPPAGVIEAALAADPTIVADAERARRRVLGFPPFGGLAELSGAPDAVDAACVVLRAVDAVGVLGPIAVGTSSRALVQAASVDALCDTLAEADLTPARDRGRLRVDVDPLRV